MKKDDKYMAIQFCMVELVPGTLGSKKRMLVVDEQSENEELTLQDVIDYHGLGATLNKKVIDGWRVVSSFTNNEIDALFQLTVIMERFEVNK